MRTTATILLVLLSCSSGRAQITEPPYGLEKVKALINSAEELDRKRQDAEKHDTDEIVFYRPSSVPIREDAYRALSLKEKFTYNMIHPESYWQNCSNLPSSWTNEYIPAQLPFIYGTLNWAERQRQFFRDNRDSVLEYIKTGSRSTKRLGQNDKTVLVIISATEMIPLLEDFYREKQDNGILTVLLLLMKNKKYSPLMEWKLYDELYGGSLSHSYRSSIEFNKTNELFILRLATDFYNELYK